MNRSQPDRPQQQTPPTMARFFEQPPAGASVEHPGDPGDAEWNDLFHGKALSPSPPPAQVGDTLGAFRLVERLGEGGMGTVFLAQHQLLGRWAAIKVLLPELAVHRDVVERFFREAQAVNLIHHPNIVDISDFVDSPGRPPFLIMELLEGQSLASYADTRGPLPPRVVVTIGLQICSAMAVVHAKGIIHRDLKPDNVFVKEQPDGTLRVKLLDFGIAKFLESDAHLSHTATGVPIGTPEYMSPEQIRGIGVDARTDIYAVGVILFELLTGKVPFSASQIGEVLIRHLEEPPVAPSTRRPTGLDEPVPRALDEAILSCLAKDPAERIQSMGQLSELLDWADTGEMSSVVIIGDPSALSRRRWPWLLTAGLAALVLLSLLVVLPTLGERTTPRKALHAVPHFGKERRPPPPPPQPRTADVLVETHPEGAALFRESDGQLIALTPARVPLPSAGSLGLRVHREGHRTVSLRLTPDTPGSMKVILVPAETAPRGASDEKAPPSSPEVRQAGHRALGPTSPRPESPRARIQGAKNAPRPRRVLSPKTSPKPASKDAIVDPFQ